MQKMIVVLLGIIGIGLFAAFALLPAGANTVLLEQRFMDNDLSGECIDIDGAVCYDSNNIIGANTIYINGTQKAIDVDIDTSGNNPILEGINYGGGAQLIVGRANGNFGSPAAVGSNAQLGTQQYFGYDGDSFDVGASINGAVCNGVTFSNTDHCAVLNFNTVGAGSTTSTQRAQITEFGYSGGKIDFPIRTVSASGTTNLSLDDYIVLCDTAPNSPTLNLPTPNSADNRLYVLRMKVSNGNSCTIATAGSETIDGAATIDLKNFAYPYSVIIVWDGSNWWIVG